MKSRRPLIWFVVAALLMVFGPTAGAAEPEDDDFASIQLKADKWTWELVV